MTVGTEPALGIAPGQVAEVVNTSRHRRCCSTTGRKKPRRTTLNGRRNRRWDKLNQWAKRRNRDVSMGRERAYALFVRPCLYCGSPPEPINGIDRFDNDVGYTLCNTVPCCAPCNYMKHTMSAREFVLRCTRVHRHLGRVVLQSGQQSWESPF